MARSRHRRLAVLLAVVGCIGYVCAPSPAFAGATTLTNEASPSGYPVGILISDAATLWYGVNPTGSITFRLYLPSNPSCAGAAVYTSTVGVTANGHYVSGTYRTTVAGTYRWTSVYSGDANNSGSATLCADAGAGTIVAKRSPTLNTSAAVLNGSSSTDTAILSGATPTGTMTYAVFGPNNLSCAGPPVFTTSEVVAGNASYTSDMFTATSTGSYRWIVNYLGDANNFAAASFCQETANAVNLTIGGGGTTTTTVPPTTTTTVAPTTTTTVPPPPGGVTVGGSPGTIADGAALTVAWAGIVNPKPTDWVGLYSPSAADWAARASRYTTGASSGSVLLTVPAGTSAGPYELRLFSDNSYNQIATSGPIYVT